MFTSTQVVYKEQPFSKKMMNNVILILLPYPEKSSNLTSRLIIVSLHPMALILVLQDWKAPGITKGSPKLQCVHWYQDFRHPLLLSCLAHILRQCRPKFRANAWTKPVRGFELAINESDSSEAIWSQIGCPCWLGI